MWRDLFFDFVLVWTSPKKNNCGSDVFLCLKGKPLEDAPEALITSTSDLDNRLSRLVSKVLSYKNQPTELNPTAMAQQLEEVKVRFKMTGCMTHYREKQKINKK